MLETRFFLPGLSLLYQKMLPPGDSGSMLISSFGAWSKGYYDRMERRGPAYKIGGSIMSIGQRRATLEDLYNEPGKAELIGGRIVQLMATGRKPNRMAGKIFRKLAEYSETAGIGEAYTDNMGFAVPELSSGRESFSPDASYYDGPMPANRMRFIEGPPKFAAEVRSENDYGEAAEAEMADKRADYFAAGTIVGGDVDP